jgi:hypothetical protein
MLLQLYVCEGKGVLDVHEAGLVCALTHSEDEAWALIYKKDLDACLSLQGQPLDKQVVIPPSYPLQLRTRSGAHLYPGRASRLGVRYARRFAVGLKSLSFPFIRRFDRTRALALM